MPAIQMTAAELKVVATGFCVSSSVPPAHSFVRFVRFIVCQVTEHFSSTHPVTHVYSTNATANDEVQFLTTL